MVITFSNIALSPSGRKVMMTLHANGRTIYKIWKRDEFQGDAIGHPNDADAIPSDQVLLAMIRNDVWRFRRANPNAPMAQLKAHIESQSYLVRV